jgi:hypothetical protein
MQKGVILGCGNRSNVGMDTVTLLDSPKLAELMEIGQCWSKHYKICYYTAILL